MIVCKWKNLPAPSSRHASMNFWQRHGESFKPLSHRKSVVARFPCVLCPILPSWNLEPAGNQLVTCRNVMIMWWLCDDYVVMAIFGRNHRNQLIIKRKTEPSHSCGMLADRSFRRRHRQSLIQRSLTMTGCCFQSLRILVNQEVHGKEWQGDGHAKFLKPPRWCHRLSHDWIRHGMPQCKHPAVHSSRIHIVRTGSVHPTVAWCSYQMSLWMSLKKPWESHRWSKHVHGRYPRTAWFNILDPTLKLAVHWG